MSLYLFYGNDLFRLLKYSIVSANSQIQSVMVNHRGATKYMHEKVITYTQNNYDREGIVIYNSTLLALLKIPYAD